MYTLAKRTCKLDRWTITSYDTFEELSEELEYCLETGWYIGSIDKLEDSTHIGDCPAIDGFGCNCEESK